MADLRVNYCGISFRNPLTVASASPTFDGEGMRRLGLMGAGAVVPKTIGPTDTWAKQPNNGRMHVYRHQGREIGLINIELFTDKPTDRWVETELSRAREGGAVIQASIMAMEEPSLTRELAATVSGSGFADLLEINASCPMPSREVGMNIGRDDELIAAHVRAAKEGSSVPVTVKLTPNVTDMVPIAQAAKDAGADGITISNTLKAFAGVDIESGIPYLRAFGGYSGAAIRPVVMRHLAEVAAAVDIPISAVGGVASYREVVEYVMLGATTVQLCTELMLRGSDVLPRILSDLNDWMDQKGIQTLDEIRGCALSKIRTVEELACEPAAYGVIDPEKCKSCGRCFTSCCYRAIDPLPGGGYAVDQARCDGCGMCVQVCAHGAVKMREKG